MKDLEIEGFIKEESKWRFISKETPPSPQGDERVVTRSLIERGFSFPPSKFFTDVLENFGLQPHNLPLNSITMLSSFTSLCEGYLGIRPSLDLFK